MTSSATSLFEGVPDKTPVVASNSNQEGASIKLKSNVSSTSSSLIIVERSYEKISSSSATKIGTLSCHVGASLTSSTMILNGCDIFKSPSLASTVTLYDLLFDS